jgi:hypothetical protein
LAHRGFIKYCRNVADLPAFIQDSLFKPPPHLLNVSLFFQKVMDDLDTWQPELIARTTIT